MPWKGEKDPYKIWLSEIILQQTRVEQGRAYYEKFVKAYPTITDLANAPDPDVFKLWEGLGYYSRCRNLLATARYIRDHSGGRFPDQYEAILALKGIGPYTAAAIASFAYNLPHAVVDGNVQRVLSRVFGIRTPVDETAGKKEFAQLAQSLLPKGKAGLYNQAIMDFGATVCKPKLAQCSSCVQNSHCIAFREGLVEQLPVKAKKLTVKERWFTYFVIRQGDRIWVRQRTAKDIWQELYEFALLEHGAVFPAMTVLKKFVRELTGDAGTEWTAAPQLYKQKLSHQTITARFFLVTLPNHVKIPAGYAVFSMRQRDQFAFPVLIRQYLNSLSSLGDSAPVKPSKK